MQYIYKLDSVGLPNFELHISTVKDGSNLVTRASVGKRDGLFFTFRVYRDYSCRWIVSPCKRATIKAIQTQQEQALKDIATIVVDVVSHYTQRTEIKTN